MRMKIIILILSLCATTFSSDVTEVADDANPDDLLAQGYVLQPDGSYLKTDETSSTSEQSGTSDQSPDVLKSQGYVQQPDGTWLKTVEDTETTYDDNEYKNTDYSDGILTVQNDPDVGYFKINKGSSDNENDYSVQAVNSPSDPSPINNPGKDDPRVYPQGNQGDPDYHNVIGVGKGKDRTFLKMVPEPSRPSGFKFIPQYISGYRPGDVTNAPEPAPEPAPETSPGSTDDYEEEPNDNPDEPNISDRKGYFIISIGKPNRRFLKLTPSTNNNPHDFSLVPIKSPSEHNSSPDPNDEEAPEVISNENRGSPDYQPVIAVGPPDNRRFTGVVVNPENPKSFQFVVRDQELQPGEAQTEPPEDDIEYEDEPPNINYKVITVGGKKNEVISAGPKNQRFHFRITHKSKNQGDIEIKAINSADNIDSSPDPDDINAPEIVQQGNPEDPNNAPIVGCGPRFRRTYHRLIITKGRARFLPLRRVKIRGRHSFIKRNRRWHYRRGIKKIARRVIKRRPLLIRRRKVKYNKRVVMHRNKLISHNRGGLLIGHKSGHSLGGKGGRLIGGGRAGNGMRHSSRVVIRHHSGSKQNGHGLSLGSRSEGHHSLSIGGRGSSNGGGGGSHHGSHHG
nr:slime protein [Eoperipatus sp.]